MAITDWPAEERPREKLLAKGASALSDAELLAIILRTGTKGLSAVDLSRQLLIDYGGLRPLFHSELQQFCQHQGLGPATYVLFQTITELSRRLLRESLCRENCFTSANHTRDYLSLILRDLPREEFHILYLDNQHQLIKDHMLFAGTIDSAAVYPREVVRQALKFQAAAVILAHNHPSGIAEPSLADQQITRRLIDALALVDIRVLDHQIVGEPQVVSMAERGFI